MYLSFLSRHLPKCYVRQVQFHGRRFFLLGTLKSGGPLCRKMPRNWEQSFAHLFEDGTIRRFGLEIGTRRDLKVLSRKERP